MLTILDMLKSLEKKGVPIFRRKNSIDAGNGIIDFVQWSNPVFFEKEIEDKMRDLCIAHLYKTNISQKHIAQRFCISPAMVKYILQKQGLREPAPARPEEARDRARKMALMRVAGVRVRDIAAHFDVSDSRAGGIIVTNKYARAYVCMLKNKNPGKLEAHQKWLDEAQ